MKDQIKIFIFCLMWLSLCLNSRAMTFDSGSSPGIIANATETAVFTDSGNNSTVQTSELTGEIESDTEESFVTELIRVDFFRTDDLEEIKVFLSAGEEIPPEYYMGSAVVNENQTVTLVDMRDDSLERILTSPYTTFQGGAEDGLMVTREVTLDPEAEPLVHLKTIAGECFRKGYFALREYSEYTVVDDNP